MSTIRSILDDKGWMIHDVAADVAVFDAIGRMCHNHIGALLVNDNNDGDLVHWTNRNHEHEIRALREYMSGVPPAL